MQWTPIIAYDIGFVVVIMRPDTSIGKRERISFILISCERSEKYRAYKKNLIWTVTSTRKCRYPFKLRAKPILGGEGRMVNLIYGPHNHALVKSFIRHPYADQLTEDEKIIIGDMTKSMVKPKNILLTLKEHNANNCRIMKQSTMQDMHTERDPIAATMHSISRVILPNLFTFLPWETNFNSVRSWK